MISPPEITAYILLIALFILLVVGRKVCRERKRKENTS